jgi:hypothetical protein
MRATEMAAEYYTEQSALRALVSLIPGVGGALDNLIAGEGTKIQQRRLAKLLEDLRLEMALIDADKLDQDFIHSEEFYDWFVATAERITRTADEAKIRALRSVFANGTVSNIGDSILKTLVLRAVGDFTGEHVRVLRALADLAPAIAPIDELPPFDAYVEVSHLHAKVAGVGQGKYIAIVNDLIRMGVLAGYFPTTFGGGTGEPTRVALSLFGREVAKFLRSESA